MARRRLLGCFAIVALTVGAGMGCKDKPDGAGSTQPATAADLDKHCGRLAKVCGDKENHIAKISEECAVAAKKHVAASCADLAIAVYGCYEKELCGGEKVWTINDLRVLAERHKKCVPEREALRACMKD